MTTRKQKTQNTKLSGVPASALKKPLEEKINKDKLQKFRELLAKKNGSEEVTRMVSQSPEEIPLVAQLLSDKHPFVPPAAMDVLKRAVLNETSRDIALDCLSDALENEKSNVQDKIALLLGAAAKGGVDISQAIPMLVKALAQEGENLRLHLEFALIDASVNKFSGPLTIFSMIKALTDDNDHIRSSATVVLLNSANLKVDISAAIPELKKALSDPNSMVRFNSAWALVIADAEDGNFLAIGELTRAFTDQILSQKCVDALTMAVEKGSRKTRVAITKAIINLMNSHEFMVEAEKNSDRYLRTIKEIDQLARQIDELEKQAA